MSTLELVGPMIPDGVHNVALRDAVFCPPTARPVSTGSHAVVKVGVREGLFTTWLGELSGTTTSVGAAETVSILDDGRRNMRLKAGQVLIVGITTVGSTYITLAGCRVSFRMARIGGRAGPIGALVSSGDTPADPNVRVALSAITKQINTGGLSEWIESVQLTDPE